MGLNRNHRARGIVVLAALLTGLAIGTAPAVDKAGPPVPPASKEADARARAALGAEGFPWYDARRDRVRAIRFRPDPEPDPPSSASGSSGGSWNWNFGDAVAFVLSVAALGALIGLAAWTWRRFEPTADAPAPAPRPARLAEVEPLLPADLAAATTDDPWAEALRRRAAGDLAGAVVCVFVHQVLAASRLDLVRLAPDRTPRQIQRGVRDPELRALMAPSLRQFEAAYYGHRDPSAAEFAAFWESAEAFQRLLAAPRRATEAAR